MIFDITKDVSTLTTIPEKTLDKYNKKIMYCICEAISEQLSDETNDNDIISLDLGYGTLFVKVIDENNLKYHFKPSDFLDKEIKATLSGEESSLVKYLNESLETKFTDVYKNLC